MSKKQFFGKYRGKVVNNVDPIQLGRLQVEVPAVLGGGRLSWALPCVPFAGPGVGFFVMPPVGANIWVEFEGGDTDSPIWTGCFWGIGEMPAGGGNPLVTLYKNRGVSVECNPGELVVSVRPPTLSQLKMSFTSAGIEIQNGKNNIKVTAKGVVVNDGALEVI